MQDGEEDEVEEDPARAHCGGQLLTSSGLEVWSAQVVSINVVDSSCEFRQW
jgi:hypothetical protein